MRKALAITALVCVSSSSIAASADYFLVIKGVALHGGHTYLNVQSSGDLDGDGLPDEGIVRLQCAGGDLRAAHYSVKSPRDSASGQASGKRTHHPVTFVKEWGAATPQLAKMRLGYNVKENKGARMTADGGGWTEIMLSDAASLCTEAIAAACEPQAPVASQRVDHAINTKGTGTSGRSTGGDCDDDCDGANEVASVSKHDVAKSCIQNMKG